MMKAVSYQHSAVSNRFVARWTEQDELEHHLAIGKLNADG
jgi:hypothetical protein